MGLLYSIFPHRCYGKMKNAVLVFFGNIMHRYIKISSSRTVFFFSEKLKLIFNAIFFILGGSIIKDMRTNSTMSHSTTFARSESNISISVSFHVQYEDFIFYIFDSFTL